MADFTCLPTETKLNVFAFVRPTPHQKTVCLVCDEWKRLMAPILWESLKTDLQETSCRRLATLLDKGNGILRYVRRLQLERDSKDKKYPELELATLLAYLPKDRLVSFEAYAVIPSIMTWLLQRQSHLQRLDAPLMLEPVCSGARLNILSRSITSWTIPSLAEISSLSVYVRTGEKAESSYEGFRHLLTNTPRLIDLCVCRDFTEDFTLTDWHASLASALPLRLNPNSQPVLKYLELSDLCLGESSRALLHDIDMSRLEGLSIQDCVEVTPFLSALSTLFSRTGAGLQRLNMSSNDPLPIREAVDSFLQTWRGLRKVVICMPLQNLVPKEGIMHHADTLELLLLGDSAGDYQRQFNLDTIDIFRKCSRVEEVAISLGPCDLGYWLDTAQSHHLEEENDKILPSSLEAVLISLSKLPELRTLRMLNLPVINYGVLPDSTDSTFNQVAIADQQVYAAQKIMQQLAGEIVRYLVRCGSHVKVLNMRPYRYQTKRPVADMNQHRWPNYTYLKKIESDEDGKELVVASPISSATLELPDALILREYEF